MAIQVGEILGDAGRDTEVFGGETAVTSTGSAVILAGLGDPLSG
jgi:hypothetical protein